MDRGLGADIEGGVHRSTDSFHTIESGCGRSLTKGSGMTAAGPSGHNRSGGPEGLKKCSQGRPPEGGGPWTARPAGGRRPGGAPRRSRLGPSRLRGCVAGCFRRIMFLVIVLRAASGARHSGGGGPASGGGGPSSGRALATGYHLFLPPGGPLRPAGAVEPGLRPGCPGQLAGLCGAAGAASPSRNRRRPVGAPARNGREETPGGSRR